MKKNLALVTAGAPADSPPANPPPALEVPKHFNVKQKAAWHDLLSSVDAELLIKANRFTFEIAATLVAKFRSGKPMNATETKEMKKQLVALGLAKDEDGGAGGKKSRNAAKYFDS